MFTAAFAVSQTVPKEKTEAKSVAISSSDSKRQQKNYVYHSTNFQPFIDALMTDGNSAIDKSKILPDSRFGQQFYVSSDPITARKEATSMGPLIKFSMSSTVVILDLTNPTVVANMGYKTKMTREDARNLMNTWNLSGIDTIKFPSEIILVELIMLL